MQDRDRLYAQARKISLAVLLVAIVTSALVGVLVGIMPVAAVLVGVIGYGTAAVLAGIGAWNAFLRLRAETQSRTMQSRSSNLSSTLRRHWPLVLIVALATAVLAAVRIAIYLR
jgi:hypothetical protein